MTTQSEEVAHADLVSGSPTSLHSHAGGGGGTDVKSGTVAGIEGTWVTVTFATAFASTPHVVTGFETGTLNNLIEPTQLRNISTTGFEVTYDHKNGLAYTIHWIATDAGNP